MDPRVAPSVSSFVELVRSFILVTLQNEPVYYMINGSLHLYFRLESFHFVFVNMNIE